MYSICTHLVIMTGHVLNQSEHIQKVSVIYLPFLYTKSGRKSVNQRSPKTDRQFSLQFQFIFTSLHVSHSWITMLLFGCLLSNSDCHTCLNSCIYNIELGID